MPEVAIPRPCGFLQNNRSFPQGFVFSVLLPVGLRAIMRHPYTKRLAGTGCCLYVEGIPSVFFSKDSSVMVSHQIVPDSLFQFFDLFTLKIKAVVSNLRLERHITVKTKGGKK
jgi:hypothetical protein